MGSATSIIVGQSLGANDLVGARGHAAKLTAFGMFVSAVTGLVMLAVAPFIPRLYQTEAHVRELATSLLTIYACCMPVFSYANTAYFILRSGGKTLITFLFDSGFTWAVMVPVAWILVHLTSLDVRAIYLGVQATDLLKVTFGHVLIRRGVWLNNMVGEGAE